MDKLTVTFLLCVYLSWTESVPRTIKIGAIFSRVDTEHHRAFFDAMEQIRSDNTAPAFNFQPIVRFIDIDTDSYNTAVAVCDLISEGVVAIFGPENKYTRGIVSSIARRFEIPHIEYGFRRIEDSELPPTSINVYPDSKIYQQAIAGMTQMMNWNSFTVIYDTADALSRIQDALSLHDPSTSNVVTVRQLGQGPDYRPLLKEVANSLDYNVLLDISSELLPEVLRQAREVKLLNDYYMYIITYLDATLLPIVHELNGTAANITGFKLTTNNDNKYTQVESALLYDAVNLFSFTLEVLHRRIRGEKNFKIDPVPLVCRGETEHKKYPAGRRIVDLMKELSKSGLLTGTMTFDEYGRRNFEPRVGEFQSNKFIETAIWNQEKGIHSTRTEEERESELRETIERKVFKVTTRVGAPHVIPVKDGSTRGVLIGDERYEGYCIDLIDAISKDLNFKYEFELVPDTKYGSYNEETKSWDGLIRRLLDRKADLAICDLTITYARQKAVDFTTPFMNLGISILFSKPENKQPDLFSFLSPLSTDVWLYMMTAYLSVSVAVYFLARIAPSEWTNPHPCDEDPEELENNFDIMNSMWLTMGSLMQQGGDILPRASSIRMIAGIWWFFVLIMVSSYTANLAAFLTAVKMDVSINDVNDLAKQTKIKYGAVKGGSTLAFFKNSNTSVYQRMYAAMIDAKPSVFPDSNDEGVERVIKGKRQYAFIMESTAIEYNIERHCELQQIGDLLDSKSYGIALPFGSPYRTMISKSILKLQEKGMLEQLKAKWWQEMHGGGTCGKQEPVQESAELGMANVGGVYVVLMFGFFAAILVGIGEFLWNCHVLAVEEKVSYCEALIHELKFTFSFHIKTKPVKITKNSSSSGSSRTFEGATPSRKSLVGSPVGSYLRLNILDKLSKENETNNRNDENKLS